MFGHGLLSMTCESILIARGETPGRAGLVKGSKLVSTHPLASPSKEGGNCINTPKGRALVSTYQFGKVRPLIGSINTPKGRALVSTNWGVFPRKNWGSGINTPKGRALVSTTGCEYFYEIPDGGINTPKGRALVSTATYCLFYHIFLFYPPYIAVFSFASISKFFISP